MADASAWRVLAASAAVLVVGAVTFYLLARQIQPAAIILPTPSGQSATPTASATIRPTPSPRPAPTTCAINPLPGLCFGRPAATQEEAAMIAVGKPDAEQELNAQDPSGCSGNELCFFIGNPSRATIGTNAATFYGEVGAPAQTSGRTACFVFLYKDALGWHYVNARCAKATGSLPGPQDRVNVSGCANVRDAPGLSSNIVACLPSGTYVDVDSGPTYIDGHIWWHLAGRGWMAHEYLT